MSKAFTSSDELGGKKISFDQVGPCLYAYAAEGDPNSGIIVGDDACIVVDAQPTPAMASGLTARAAKVTDRPIRYVLLTHYRAARTLGASVFTGTEVLASDVTRALIAERGKQDMESEIGRFPRLRFHAAGDGPEVQKHARVRAHSAVQRVARLRRSARHRMADDLDGGPRPRDLGGPAGVKDGGSSAPVMPGLVPGMTPQKLAPLNWIRASVQNHRVQTMATRLLQAPPRQPPEASPGMAPVISSRSTLW